MPRLELRPYQNEALEALDRHFAKRDDNPCVVLPTGSGKSYVMAEMIRRRIESNRDFRCIVLAHRLELVEQNYEEFVNLMGTDVSAGRYCVGAGYRDTNASVVFAMIQSVYRHAGDFPAVDMVVVDEAHHIPITTNGMYRTFLNGIMARNPHLRVAGFTATPYRLDVGHVCHEDYVLNRICYEANVGDLIDKGYLCRLRSNVSRQTPDLEGVSECGGDYNLHELSNRVCVSELVHNAVRDARSRLNAERRRCCVWFCVDVNHCTMVRDELRSFGEAVNMVTGETPRESRKNIVDDFRQGSIRHLVNVQVFTEGFNVKQVDAVVLLRPTLSRGLYVQMVGRGLRVHPDKNDCIVLDYARCIEEHGPIDQRPDQYVPMEICDRCGEYFPRELRNCPNCGYVVSEEEVRRHNDNDERRRRIRTMHDEMATYREILAQEYGCVSSQRVINKESHVKQGLLTFASQVMLGNNEYNARSGRTIPRSFEEFQKFLEYFIEYAKDVQLTNLPDMVRDYFENENLHDSEYRRIRSERRRRKEEEFRRFMERRYPDSVH